MQDQRAAERVKTSLFAIWDMSQQSVASGDVINVSTQGCFMHSRNGLPKSETVDLQLRLPTERWLHTKGRIIHTSEPDGFGVSFTELSEEDRRMLGLLVEYYRAVQ